MRINKIKLFEGTMHYMVIERDKLKATLLAYLLVLRYDQKRLWI